MYEILNRADPTWWDYDGNDPSELASSVVSRVTGIEDSVWGVRWQNAMYARLATGRDLPTIMGSWMNRRVGPVMGSYQNTQFELPRDNIVAQVIDTLANRVGGTRPWITVQPSGDMDTRTKSRKLTSWFAGVFEALRLYQDVTLPCSVESQIFGTSAVEIGTDASGKKLELNRILRDEILINELEGEKGKVTNIIIARLVNRDDLKARYKNDKDALQAIEDAPSAFANAFSPGIDMNNTVLTFRCWKLKRADGSPGRFVVALPNYALEDKDYDKDEFPIAFLRCVPMPLSFWGQGVPEALWDYQLELNRCMGIIHTGQLKATGTLFIEGNSRVSSKTLTNAQWNIVRYEGVKPEYDTPKAVSQEVYDWYATIKQAGFMRFGIAPEDAGSLKPPGLNSGRALITYEQIRDARHVNMAKALEDFVTDIAYKLIDVAKELNLAAVLPEGRIDWGDVEMQPGSFKLRAFPVSSLPSEPAGRQQIIDNWFANGIISRQDKLRLEMVPDTEHYASMATAAQDEIEWTLDQIVDTGQFQPPEIYEDLVMALKIAQARYLYEKVRRTPRPILKLLQQFIMAIVKLSTNPTSLPQVGAMPPVGIQPPTTDAPAPSPIQVAPAVGAVAPIGAAA